MRRAIVWRSLVSGTISCFRTAGPRMAGVGTRGAAGIATGMMRPVAIAASTSRLTMRPPGPVPVSSARFSPACFAMRFASGEALMRPFALGGAGATGVTAGDTAPAGTGGAACGVAGADGAATGAVSTAAFRRIASRSSASSAEPTTPIRAPTGTVWPGSRNTPRSTPSAGASISMFTLSVSISATGSPRLTGSPTRFSHCASLPSVMSKPILGIVSSVAIDYSVLRVAYSVTGYGTRNTFSRYRRLHRRDDVLLPRQGFLLDVPGVRQRHFFRADAPHRRVQPVEAFFADARGDLGLHTERAPFLGHDDGAIRLAHRLEDGLQIERAQRAQIDDLCIDSFLGQHVRRAKRRLEHAPVGHDRHVLAGALNVALAERHDVVAVRHLALDAVDGGMLEEDDWIGIADGGLEHALRVVGRAGEGHLQAGDVCEHHLERLRVRRAQLAPATGHAHDERHAPLPSEHVMHLRGVVDDLVHRQEAKVDRHKLGDGALPADRRAHRHADDRAFGNGRVPNAILAEFVEQAARHGVRAAVRADVLAHDEYTFVAQHFLAHRLLQRFADSDDGHVSPRSLVIS